MKALSIRESLPELLLEAACDEPTRPLVHSVEHGSLTFSDLDSLSRRWAHILESEGVGANDTVLTLIPSSPTAIAVWLGAAWLTAIEVPMNPAYRGDWVRHVLRNSRARIAVVATRYADSLLEVEDSFEDLKTILLTDGDVAKASSMVRIKRADPNAFGIRQPVTRPTLADTACVIYTSGTTGASKGVIVSWRQLFQSALSGAIPEDRRAHDIYYAPFGAFHSTGKLPVVGAVARRSQIVIKERFNTASFWSDIERFKCTSTLLVGAMANFLYRQPPAPGDATNTLRDVLMVPVIPEVDDFKRRFNVNVHTCFNMTEISTPIVSGGAPVTSKNHRSCGRLREGFSLRIVDEKGADCAPCATGELWVRAEDPAAIARGYFGMPDKTKEAFVDGWFRTGDLFTHDATGNYFFLDRLKDYIRRRGENISSFEIEAAVCSHESVLECAAVAVPSAWGEEEVKISVVPRLGKHIDCAELHAYLSSRVPQFAVPRYIEVLEMLPRTPTDRVRKAVLRQSGVGEATWDSQAGKSP